ncbi:MAG: hypothetical protein ACOC95_08800 [Planctomycetota bacterium]
MQYLVAIAWVAYIIHGLRRAYAKHYIAQRARQLGERLARVEAGMTPAEVRALLGPPVRVTPSPEGLTWQYRVGGTFHPILFVRGAGDDPPVAMLDASEEDIHASHPQEDPWERDALAYLRRAS